MNRAFYMGNCLSCIDQALRQLPPNRWYQTWQEVGQIVAMPSVEERHARLMQLSDILQESIRAKPETRNSKLPA